MVSRIFKYQMIADLNVSENQNVLSEFERGLVFERKAEIVNRLMVDRKRTIRACG